eukprot:650148-Rhodomonas_salina.2
MFQCPSPHRLQEVVPNWKRRVKKWGVSLPYFVPGDSLTHLSHNNRHVVRVLWLFTLVVLLLNVRRETLCQSLEEGASAAIVAEVILSLVDVPCELCPEPCTAFILKLLRLLVLSCFERKEQVKEPICRKQHDVSILDTHLPLV